VTTPRSFALGRSWISRFWVSLGEAEAEKLSLRSLAALVVASMIGAGVFSTSGFALADLGTRPRVLAAWGVGGLIAMAGAYCYGALARELPRSGGETMYLAERVHPLAGFLAGWVSLTAGFTGAIAWAAHTLESYVLADNSFGPAGTVAMLAVLLATAVHVRGLRPGSMTQDSVVAIKLLGLVLFIVFAALNLPTTTAPDPASVAPLTLPVFATSLMWISLSYAGFNAAVYVAAEAHTPTTTVPRALLLGTALTTLLYLGLNAVFLYATDPSVLAGRPDVAGLAAEAIGGEVLGNAVRVLIALALFTSISGMVMTGPRVYAVMAELGTLPRVFRFDHSGSVTRLSIAFQGGLALVVVWLAEIQELLDVLGFTLSLSAAATVATLIPARTGRPLTLRVVALCFAGCSTMFAVIAGLRAPGSSATALGVLAVGALIWALQNKLRRRR
jgi:amino acid transporter